MRIPKLRSLMNVFMMVFGLSLIWCLVFGLCLNYRKHVGSQTKTKVDLTKCLF